jgi:hypothetical protein
MFDNKDTFENHGYYSIYGFIMISLLGIPIVTYISYIIYFSRKKLYKHLAILLAPLIIICTVCYIRFLFLVNCYGYHIGLNGVKIDDDPTKYSCFYDYPKKCYIDILSPFFDYSPIAGRSCKTIRNLKKQKEYFTYFLIDNKKFENTTKFGFPITTTPEYSLKTQNDVNHFNERVSKNVIDMDVYDNITYPNQRPLKPEVILDFSEDPNGEIKIKINKNKQLSNERKKLGFQYKSKFDNIIFILIL